MDRRTHHHPASLKVTPTGRSRSGGPRTPPRSRGTEARARRPKVTQEAAACSGGSGPHASNFPGSRNFLAGQRPLSSGQGPFQPPRGAQALGSSTVLAPQAQAREGGGSRASDPSPVAPPRRLQRPIVPRTRRSGRKCHSLNSFPPGPSLARAGQSPGGRYADPGWTLRGLRTPPLPPHSPGSSSWPAGLGSRLPAGAYTELPTLRPVGVPSAPQPPPPGSRRLSHHVRHCCRSHPEPVPPRSARSCCCRRRGPAGPAPLPACLAERSHWPLRLPMQMNRWP